MIHGHRGARGSAGASLCEGPFPTVTKATICSGAAKSSRSERFRRPTRRCPRRIRTWPPPLHTIPKCTQGNIRGCWIRVEHRFLGPFFSTYAKVSFTSVAGDDGVAFRLRRWRCRRGLWSQMRETPAIKSCRIPSTAVLRYLIRRGGSLGFPCINAIANINPVSRSTEVKQPSG